MSRAKKPQKRPSKSKYDTPISIKASPDDVAKSIVSTTPEQLKSWRKKQKNK